MAQDDGNWFLMTQHELNFDDLRSTFVEYISFMPLRLNNETVLKAYEKVFETIDKLEDKYTDD